MVQKTEDAGLTNFDFMRFQLCSKFRQRYIRLLFDQPLHKFRVFAELVSAIAAHWFGLETSRGFPSLHQFDDGAHRHIIDLGRSVTGHPTFNCPDYAFS